MEINYELQVTDVDLRIIKPLFAELAQKTTDILKLKRDYVISVIFTDSLTIQRINKEYRKIDSVTDVISFALHDNTSVVTEEIEIELGDIFINCEFARKQAVEYDHSLKREYAFLFVHGLLHLLGYDHLESSEETEMFTLQDLILDDIVGRKL